MIDGIICSVQGEPKKLNPLRLFGNIVCHCSLHFYHSSLKKAMFALQQDAGFFQDYHAGDARIWERPGHACNTLYPRGIVLVDAQGVS